MVQKGGKVMATCPRCKRHFRVPEDEQGDHGCPRCGYFHGDEREEDDDEA